MNNEEGGYSEKYRKHARDKIEKLNAQNQVQTYLRRKKVKELSRQTNNLRRKLEQKKKSREDTEEERRQKILKNRKEKLIQATEKFQRFHVKETVNGGHSSKTSDPFALLDGIYSIRGHVVEIKDGKRVYSPATSSHRDAVLFVSPSSRAHPCHVSPTHRHSAYSGQASLSSHISSLLGDKRQVREHQGGTGIDPSNLEQTMQPARSDNAEVCQDAKQTLSLARHDFLLQNCHTPGAPIALPLRDNLATPACQTSMGYGASPLVEYSRSLNFNPAAGDVQAMKKSSAIEEGLTSEVFSSQINDVEGKEIDFQRGVASADRGGSPVDSIEDVDENENHLQLKSSLKRSYHAGDSLRNIRKVTFSDSIEFDDGNTWPLFAGAPGGVPFYKRIENRASDGDGCINEGPPLAAAVLTAKQRMGIPDRELNVIEVGKNDLCGSCHHAGPKVKGYGVSHHDDGKRFNNVAVVSPMMSHSAVIEACNEGSGPLKAGNVATSSIQSDGFSSESSSARSSDSLNIASLKDSLELTRKSRTLETFDNELVPGGCQDQVAVTCVVSLESSKFSHALITSTVALETAVANIELSHAGSLSHRGLPKGSVAPSHLQTMHQIRLNAEPQPSFNSSESNCNGFTKTTSHALYVPLSSTNSSTKGTNLTSLPDRAQAQCESLVKVLDSVNFPTSGGSYASTVNAQIKYEYRPTVPRHVSSSAVGASQSFRDQQLHDGRIPTSYTCGSLLQPNPLISTYPRMTHFVQACSQRQVPSKPTSSQPVDVQVSRVSDRSSFESPSNNEVATLKQAQPKSRANDSVAAVSNKIYADVERKMAGLSLGLTLGQVNACADGRAAGTVRPSNFPHGDIFSDEERNVKPAHLSKATVDSSANASPSSDVAHQKGSNIPVRVHSSNASIRRGRIIVSAGSKRSKEVNGIVPRPPSKPCPKPHSAVWTMSEVPPGASFGIQYRNAPVVTHAEPHLSASAADSSKNAETIACAPCSSAADGVPSKHHAYETQRTASHLADAEKKKRPPMMVPSRPYQHADVSNQKSAPPDAKVQPGSYGNVVEYDCAISCRDQRNGPSCKSTYARPQIFHDQALASVPNHGYNLGDSIDCSRARPLCRSSALAPNQDASLANPHCWRAHAPHSRDAAVSSNVSKHFSNGYVPLDKTPTDDEINRLWANVRECLVQTSEEAMSDSVCVVRTRADQVPLGGRRHSAQARDTLKRSLSGSDNFQGAHAAHSSGRQALPFRRYGSHEVLDRVGQQEDASRTNPYREKQALLPQRFSRVMKGGGFVPMESPKQSLKGPLIAKGKNVSASMASFLAMEELCEKQSFSPSYIEAASLASRGVLQHGDGLDSKNRNDPSALSVEERRVMESLERINQKLQAQTAFAEKASRVAVRNVPPNPGTSAHVHERRTVSWKR